MKWREISKERPPHGELIWVWDMEECREFLIRYKGSEDCWLRVKDSSNCPIWRPLNEE